MSGEIPGPSVLETQPEGKLTIEEVSRYCGDIPVGPEKYAGFNLRDENVADHEFSHHVLLAYGLGLSVQRVSIKRLPGVYEGVTELVSRPEDSHKLQIVAAGGYVHGHGYGSDLQHVHNGHREGGYAPDQAISIARNFINRIDPEVRKVANQILAFRKEIFGWQIPEILTRARLEVLYNQQNGLSSATGRELMQSNEDFEELIGRVSYLNRRVVEVPGAMITEKRTVIEDLGNGRERKYEMVNGIVDLTTIVERCGACGKEDGHKKSCEFVGRKEEKESVTFPKKATIYQFLPSRITG